MNGDVTLPRAVKQIPQKSVHRKPRKSVPQGQVRGARTGDRRIRELESRIEALRRVESEQLLQAQRAQEEITELRRDSNEKLAEAQKEIARLQEQLDQLQQHLSLIHIPSPRDS